MAIIQTVNASIFRQAFIDMDRKESFSYAGLEALFDYLEQLSEDTDEPIEMDVIAICCDYSEHSEDELMEEYSHMLDKDDYEDEGEYLEALVSELQDNTTVIEVDHTEGTRYIVQSF